MFRRIHLKPYLALAGLLCIAATAGAASTCQNVTAEGETFFDGTAFVGTGTFVIEGVAHEATSSTVILETVKETNGAIHLITSHLFDFGGGDTVRTRDRVTLAPTSEAGVYRLNSVLEVAEGTGIYANATGKMTTHDSTIDLVAGHAIWKLNGKLCP